MCSRIRISLILGIVLSASTIAWEATAQDQVDGRVIFLREDSGPCWGTFRATGIFTTIDQVLGPPWPAIAGPPFAVAGADWRFELRHRVQDWDILPAAGNEGGDDVQISISGEHTNGPHKPNPPGDIDPNLLPEKSSDPVDIIFMGLVIRNAAGDIIGRGVPVRVTAQGREKHPTAALGDHTDVYGVQSWISTLPAMAPPDPGPGNAVAGPFIIAAKHTKNSKESLPFQLTMGSSSSAGSMVSYDAQAGLLSFVVGPIDILNGTGFIGAGIDPQYSSDPILSTQVIATAVQFQGIAPDGRFKFGGGHVQLVDPGQQMTFNGAFSEYLIEETSRTDTLTSYALFDTLRTADVLDDCISEFLEDFENVNLFGHGITESEWTSLQGIDFAFSTAIDLVQLTSGFTQSAFNIPATYVVCGNSNPEYLTGVGPGGTDLPRTFGLLRSYPNPSTAVTTIDYELAAPSPVDLGIYDSAGRRIRVLVDLPAQEKGRYSVTWDGKDDAGRSVASGTYFFRLEGAASVKANHTVLVR